MFKLASNTCGSNEKKSTNTLKKSNTQKSNLCAINRGSDIKKQTSNSFNTYNSNFATETINLYGGSTGGSATRYTNSCGSSNGSPTMYTDSCGSSGSSGGFSRSISSAPKSFEYQGWTNTNNPTSAPKSFEYQGWTNMNNTTNAPKIFDQGWTNTNNPTSTPKVFDQGWINTYNPTSAPKIFDQGWTNMNNSSGLTDVKADDFIF